MTSQKTGRIYKERLNYFIKFLNIEHPSLSLDELIKTLNVESYGPKIDVYDLLSSYVSYLLQKEGNIAPITIKQWVVTVKNFLEYWDVEISPRKFKLKVKMPKIIKQSKEALSKEDIIIILNACTSIKLKTYVMCLAATGCRAQEALSTRLCDYNLDKSKVFIRGEYTRTKTDRHTFLTSEMVEQIKAWIVFKYRRRRISYKGKTTVKTPVMNGNDLLFSSDFGPKYPSIHVLYRTLVASFDQTLDRLGGKYAEYETIMKRRRKITLHSFRRFVKSTISDLGYSDFSEWYIGHSGSTYYRRSDKDKFELFRKIEPYLTFLDQTTLERKGADQQTRIEELEATNQMLRKKDSMNADAIASLSDRMQELMTKVHEMEKKK
jgi:integrase